MAIRGKGTKYARKYVKVDVDTLRHEIIPQVADFCARKRAELALSPDEYRKCIKDNIKRKIKGEELAYP